MPMRVKEWGGLERETKRKLNVLEENDTIHGKKKCRIRTRVLSFWGKQERVSVNFLQFCH